VVNSKHFGVKALHHSLPKITNQMFDRRLRMMRADMFALLSVSQTEEFFKTPAEAEMVKNAVVQYLESERADKVLEMEVVQKLKGWNKILHQKCNMN
jgi:hypothetical protein